MRWLIGGGLVCRVALLVAVLFVATTLATAAAVPTTAGTPVIAGVNNAAIRVSWKVAGSTAGMRQWMIELQDLESPKWPATHAAACKGCTSAVIPDAVPGRTYRASVWAVATNGSKGPITTSNTLTLVDPLCPDPKVPCAGVDVRQYDGAFQHRAGGLNSGWLAGSAPAEAVATVNETSARIDRWSDPATWAALRQRGATITFMVNSYYAMVEGGPTAPWRDWDHYRSVLTKMVSDMAAKGEVPDYWEVQNEPDYPGNYGVGVTPTRAQLLAQHKIAYQAIKAANPNAKIVGPSLSGFYWDDPSRPLDLRSFLDFADANKLQFAGVTWHENGLPGDLDLWEIYGRGIPSDVQRLRVALAASSALRNAKPMVNEVLPSWMSDLPGGMIGWLAHAENSGAELIALSCWPFPNDPVPAATNPGISCSPDAFDGLRHYNGNPSPTWAPHMAYRATLQGNLIGSRTNKMGWSSLAAQAKDSVINIMLARHETCRADINPLCDVATNEALRSLPGVVNQGHPADAMVVVATARPAGTIMRVSATRYSPTNLSGVATLPEPTPTIETAAAVGINGTVKVVMPQVQDGEAWLVQVAS